ncbi:hypothetical protein Tco_0015346 [Tanacetum coccineum]
MWVAVTMVRTTREARDVGGGLVWWLGDGGVGCGGTAAGEEGGNASGVDGRLDRVTRKLFEAHRKTPPEKFSGGGDVVAGGGRVAGGELHYLLDKVVSVGTAPGPNSSDHNVNTITNGDGMPKMRTFRETIFP